MRFSIRLALSTAALLTLLAAPPLSPTATAGCGCDHPPPAFAPIMPPFASGGTVVTLNASGFLFELGSTYEVDFGSGDPALVTANDVDEVSFAMPQAVLPGPIAVEVTGPGVDYQYGEASFTALPAAVPMPSGDGVAIVVGYQAAVSADGTLLLPFDVDHILEPTQFAFVLGSLRLDFTGEDVVFWNQDGVDLTLFTLDVADPTQRQWGSYYGWDVNQDAGIAGPVYNRRRRGSMGLLAFSDLLTYWRHEFHAYKTAHEPGGTHEVNEHGYHEADGTRHIDHGNLVLALSGLERTDFWDPTVVEPLSPGSRVVELFVATMASQNPIEPGEIHTLVRQAVLTGNVSRIQAPTGDASGGLADLLSVYASEIDD